MHNYMRIRTIHVTGVVIRDADYMYIYRLNYSRSYRCLRISTQDMLKRMFKEIEGSITIASIQVNSELIIPKPDDKYPNAVYYRTNGGYYPVPNMYQFMGEIR